MLFSMTSGTSRPFLIAVVDDDEFVREALESLLKSSGFRADTYSSAEEFLASPNRSTIDCLILDVKLGGLSGPELQQRLLVADHLLPIIFVTAHADEVLRAKLMEAGAFDCFMKPFNDTLLLGTLEEALKSHGPNPRDTLDQIF